MRSTKAAVLHDSISQVAGKTTEALTALAKAQDAENSRLREHIRTVARSADDAVALATGPLRRNLWGRLVWLLTGK